MNQTNFIVNAPMKSVAVSVLLTIFFGGLGLLYSTVKGGVIMVIVELINIIFCFFIIGFFFLPIIHLICVAWGVTAVQKYNNELMVRMRN
jgi:hypothetical protein